MAMFGARGIAPIDYMSGVEEAFAQNAAMAPAQRQVPGWRNVLGNIVGSIGDNLSGNNAFASQVQRRQMMEYEDQQRQRQRREGMEDWKAKDAYKRANPDAPEWEQAATYLESQGRNDEAADIRAKARMVSQQVYNPSTGAIELQYFRPSQLMGGGSAPTVTSKEAYDALPPGAEYTDPTGKRRRKGGASPSNGSGGFPGPY